MAPFRCAGRPPGPAGEEARSQPVELRGWARPFPRTGCGPRRTREFTLIKSPFSSNEGRKQRITPLTKHTANVLRAWTKERAGAPQDPLFPSSRGRALSRDAVALIVTRHTETAGHTCPTLATRTVSPHVPRHTTGMNLLHAGVDTSVIALWFGHESTEATQIYLHADMAIKERALARTARPASNPSATTPRRATRVPRGALIMPSAEPATGRTDRPTTPMSA
jgi:hypothetical protein